jgi:hypothetical protein
MDFPHISLCPLSILLSHENVGSTEQAKIFVIPTLCNILNNKFITSPERLCLKYVNSKERRCNQGVFWHDANILLNSTYFQRNQGRDHVMTASTFTNGHGHRMPANFRENVMNKTNLISFELDNFAYFQYDNKNRISYPAYYVGNPCPNAYDIPKTFDIAMIATLNAKRPTFKDRENICKWLVKQKSHIRMPVCGKGSQCPALSQSKYGFHVRGDTLGANRLFDNVLSNTVPVFTSPKQYSVEPPWIDWPQLSEIVNVSTKETLIADLDRILNDTEGYERKLAAINQHRHLFDWKNGLYPFDTYMYMFQAQLFPETKRPKSQSPYPALILP